MKVSPMMIPVIGAAAGILIIIFAILRRIGIQFRRRKTVKGRKKAQKRKRWMYALLLKIPIVKNHILQIKQTLFITSNKDEGSLQEETIVVIRSSILSFILTFAGVYIVFHNIILAVFAGCIVYNLWVQKKIGDGDRLLLDLIDALDKLNHYYMAENQIVENAYIQTIKRLDDNTRLHLQRILKIIQLPYKNAQRELKTYNNECSNEYLKMLAKYSLYAKEFSKPKKSKGTNDDEAEEESEFQRGLFTLIIEMQTEYRKRSRIRVGVHGEAFFIVLPIFMLPLAKEYVLWGVRQLRVSMELIDQFYNGSIGYMTMIICAMVSVVCYTAYRRKTNNNKAPVKRNAWEDNLLKFSIVSKFIKRISPPLNSLKDRILKEKMIRAGKLEKIERFYVQKVVFACLIGVLFISIIQGNKIITKNSLFQDLSYGIMNDYVYQNLLSMVSEFNQEEQEEIKKKDQELVKELFQEEQELSEMDEEEKKEYVIELLKEEGTSEMLLEMTAERIIAKFQALKRIDRSYILWVFVALGIIGGYFTPDILLNLEGKKNRERMMQDEVMRFQTIILLLIYQSHITVEEVLEWLLLFSDIFYNPIKRAMNNYSKGGVKALKELRESVYYERFQRIIDSLILAEEKLPLKKAFAGLELRQRFNEKQREDQADQIVDMTIRSVSRLATISIFTTIVLYVGVPLTIAGFSKLLEIRDTLYQLNQHM